jgi:hypothetical protein
MTWSYIEKTLKIPPKMIRANRSIQQGCIWNQHTKILITFKILIMSYLKYNWYNKLIYNSINSNKMYRNKFNLADEKHWNPYIKKMMKRNWT